MLRDLEDVSDAMVECEPGRDAQIFDVGSWCPEAIHALVPELTDRFDGVRSVRKRTGSSRGCPLSEHRYHTGARARRGGIRCRGRCSLGVDSRRGDVQRPIPDGRSRRRNALEVMALKVAGLRISVDAPPTCDRYH